ncbi:MULTISPECIES: CrcB family protein [unclassified Actinotalea]|uniref:fluoride efflux transporter FluC n=1 Tax=unclassified Actinotalea TaxID=2638618 RepID=UPI0021046ED6|nr:MULTISPECIES: CrcB family protein [unclassified Actinotalea]
MNAAPGRARISAASFGLVVLGGFFGVAAREGLSLAVPDVDGVPVVITLVNVVGAFLLGFLYEGLARRAPGEAVVSRLKLLLGTGFCGGLTTYSSLATDTAVLLDRSRLDLGAAYVLGTVLLGAAATFAGIALGARLRGPTRTGEGVA